jgi:hypothetical protein
MQYTLDSNFYNFRGIYPTAVLQRFLTDYWLTFPLAHLTGGLGSGIESARSCIIDYPLVPGGEKSTYSVRIPKKIGADHTKFRKNFDKRLGYAQEIESVYDDFTYDYYSQVGKYQNTHWLAVGQPLLADIPSYVMEDLTRREALHTQDLFFASIFKDLYNLAVQGKMPRTERAVAGLKNYVYAHNATLPATLHALIANHAVDRPTVKHIRALYKKLRTKDIRGGLIRPLEMKTYKGYPYWTYLLLVSRTFYNLLCEDADFKEQFLARGMALESQPNSVEGMDWRGKVEGFDLVICDELDSYMFDADGGNAEPVCWSLALGSQAFVKGIAPLKSLSKDVVEADDEAILSTHFVKGVKCLTFPRIESLAPGYVATPNDRVEQGIVHSFTVGNMGA